MANAERCVCCGEIIPEGRMVCPNCEEGSKGKRLIDANELTDRLNHTTMVAYPNIFPGLLAAVEVVDDSPTVDAVEVVRCKDCKYWKKFESSLLGSVMCCTGQGSMNIQKAADDFCSYGERKDND